MENIEKTLSLIKEALSAGPNPGAVSADVAKSFTGFGTSLNLYPYNLEPGARLLFPVMSPLRNVIRRKKGYGKATQFKAITGLSGNTVTNIFAQEGTKGNVISTSEVDVTIGYVPMGLGDQVSLEGQIQFEGQVDARALATANLLRAYMIAEENAILYGIGATSQATSSAGSGYTIGGASGAPSHPTGTQNTSAGSVGAGTYDVRQTIVTGMGESTPDASGGHLQLTLGGTGQLFVTPTPTAGYPALSYNIYYKLSSDTNYNVVSTNGKQVTITSYTAGSATLPAADTTALTGTPAAFNGLAAQISAYNSGATSGYASKTAGYTTALNGTLTKASIDTALRTMWDVARADPDQIYCNSFEGQTITSVTLEASAAARSYFLTVDEQAGATVNYRAERYINPITGTRVKVDVHPFVNQGNMFILSTKMPAWYPGSNIDAVWSMEMPLDYTLLEYFPTAPAWPFEVRTIGALLLYLPSTQGWIQGISTS